MTTAQRPVDRHFAAAWRRFPELPIIFT